MTPGVVCFQSARARFSLKNIRSLLMVKVVYSKRGDNPLFYSPVLFSLTPPSINEHERKGGSRGNLRSAFGTLANSKTGVVFF